MKFLRLASLPTFIFSLPTFSPPTFISACIIIRFRGEKDFRILNLSSPVMLRDWPKVMLLILGRGRNGEARCLDSLSSSLSVTSYSCLSLLLSSHSSPHFCFFREATGKLIFPIGNLHGSMAKALSHFLSIDLTPPPHGLLPLPYPTHL